MKKFLLSLVAMVFSTAAAFAQDRYVEATFDEVTDGTPFILMTHNGWGLGAWVSNYFRGFHSDAVDVAENQAHDPMHAVTFDDINDGTPTVFTLQAKGDGTYLLKDTNTNKYVFTSSSALSEYDNEIGLSWTLSTVTKNDNAGISRNYTVLACSYSTSYRWIGMVWKGGLPSFSAGNASYDDLIIYKLDNGPKYKTFETSPAPVDGKWALGTKFYTIKCQRNGYMNSAATDYYTGCLMLNRNYVDGDNTKWAMVQTPNGLQFYNKAAGTEKVLHAASTSNDAVTTMSTDKESATSYFEIVTDQNPIFAAGYECIKVAGDNLAYFNDKSNKLAIWESAQALWGWQGSEANPKNGDDGSKFLFTLVEELMTVSYTINFVDAPADAYVTINGQQYTAGTYEFTGTVAASSVQAATYPAYKPSVTVENDVITVTYVYSPYPVNFTNRQHAHGTDVNGRVVTALKLGDQIVEINGKGNFYQDLTETAKFTVKAGQTLKPAIVWNGYWMHGFVYVDTNSADHAFTVDELAAQTPTPGGYTVDLLTDFSNLTAPEVPGLYRMRYKVDWASTDPAGASDLCQNGGYVLDLMLEVLPTSNWEGVATPSIQTAASLNDLEGMTLTFDKAETVEVLEDGYIVVGNEDGSEIYAVWSPAYEGTYTVDGNVVTLNDFCTEMEGVITAIPEGTYEVTVEDFGAFSVDGLEDCYFDTFTLAYTGAPLIPRFELAIENNGVLCYNHGAYEAPRGVSRTFKVAVDNVFVAGDVEGVQLFSIYDTDFDAPLLSIDGKSIVFDTATKVLRKAGAYSLSIPEGVFVTADGAINSAFVANWVIYEDIDTEWTGEIIAANEAASVDELIEGYTLTFEEALSVEASNYDVYGAIYDANGQPIAVAICNGVFDVYGGLEIDGDKATVCFARLADLSGDQLVMARAAAAKLGRFIANGADKATVVFGNNSFLVDGKLSNVFCKEVTILGGGLTTGIESIATDVQAPVYDLTGRRVLAPSKGLYIQNGKAVIK